MSAKNTTLNASNRRTCSPAPNSSPNTSSRICLGIAHATAPTGKESASTRWIALSCTLANRRSSWPNA